MWQKHLQQNVPSQVVDPEFEKRLQSLPPQLHLHPILEKVGSYLEEEVNLIVL